LTGRAIVRVAAVSAAIAIAAGAFGAHAAQGKAVDWLHTGAMYQLIHAVAVIVVLPRSRTAALLMLVGAAIFAFSLYAMALGAPRWFGAITPLGGIVMIVGWLWLAFGRSAASVRTIDD
jgi:uncharacterized membrane protein YgdD (TMEM256/DUF423 family)